MRQLVVVLATVLLAATGISGASIPTRAPVFTVPSASGTQVSPVRCDGMLCFAINGSAYPNPNNVLALDASTGATIWSATTKIGNGLNIPAVGHGIVAFAGHYGTHVSVYNATTGAVHFDLTVTRGQEVICVGPAATSFGVAVTTTNRTLMLDTMTGTILWENKQAFCPTSGGFSSNRFAYTYDTLYFVQGSNIVALNMSTGQIDFSVPVVKALNATKPAKILNVLDAYVVGDGVLLGWQTEMNSYIGLYNRKTGYLKWINTFTSSGSVFTALISVSQAHNNFVIQEAGPGFNGIVVQSYAIDTGAKGWGYGPYPGFNNSAPAGDFNNVLAPNYGGGAYVFSTLENVLVVDASTGAPLWQSPVQSDANWANFGIATSGTGSNATAYAVAPVSFDGVSHNIASWQINNLSL